MPAVINCQFAVGFPALYQPPFLAAAATWGGILNSTVPILVRGVWMGAGSMPPNLAAMCVPNGSLWGNPPPLGIRAATWYVSALADKITQQDQHPGQPDMTVLFNSALPWNAAPVVPAPTYDLESVTLHEMAHGLGMLGLFFTTPPILGPVVGSYGNPAILGQLPPGVGYGFPLPVLGGQPSIFGTMVRDANGQFLTNPNYYAPNSQALGAALSGPALYFDQINPQRLLYTPNPFQLFSSAEHLADPNSLMCHSIGLGVNRRVVDAPVRTIMTRLGW